MTFNIKGTKEITQQLLGDQFPEWAVSGIVGRFEENYLVDDSYTADVLHARTGFIVLTPDDCMHKYKLRLSEADIEECDDEDELTLEIIQDELGNKVVEVYNDPAEGSLLLIEDY